VQFPAELIDREAKDEMERRIGSLTELHRMLE
jgi:hypothetical protein